LRTKSTACGKAAQSEVPPKVIFYDVGGDWEIDIVTAEGFIGFDVPIGEVRITRR
jgi:hypothetical protein